MHNLIKEAEITFKYILHHKVNTLYTFEGLNGPSKMMYVFALRFKMHHMTCNLCHIKQIRRFISNKNQIYYTKNINFNYMIILVDHSDKKNT